MPIPKRGTMIPIVLSMLLLLSPSRQVAAQEPETWPQHSRSRPMAPVETPPPQSLPVLPPPGARVLFDGTNLDGTNLAQWQRRDGSPAQWTLLPDGSMEVAPRAGGIQTVDSFGDLFLHVEWASPNPPAGADQNRGNSGVFLMGIYEVQVLDSYQSATYADGQAAAIYGQFPPRVNVSRPPSEWQTFDIEFRRPHFDEQGRLTKPARMTVRHNDVLVHDDVELLGPTSNNRRAPYEAHAPALPISLQDHGHPVRFRNIWLRPL